MYLIVIVTFIIVKWLSVTGDIKKSFSAIQYSSSDLEPLSKSR